jgi:hypothetical protein
MILEPLHWPRSPSGNGHHDLPNIRTMREASQRRACFLNRVHAADEAHDLAAVDHFGDAGKALAIGLSECASGTGHLWMRPARTIHTVWLSSLHCENEGADALSCKRSCILAA